MSTHRDHHRRSRSPTSRHHRSRSPTDDSHSSRRHHYRNDRDRRRSNSPKPATGPVLLPSNAKPLDLQTSLPIYFAVFAKYLDIQKSIKVVDIDERELRSRFKRFVGRWNMGELASSWYDKDYKVQIDGDRSLPSWDEYLKFQKESKGSSRRRHSGDRDRERDRDGDRREKDGDRRNRERSHRDKDRDRHRDKDRDRERDRNRSRERRRDRDRDGRRDRELERRKKSAEPETHEQTESRIRNMTDEELTRALQKLEGNESTSRAISEDVEMKDDDDDSDDSDMIGPALPDSFIKAKAGAKPPNTQDLELQKELDEEEAELRRADLRYERKKERKLEKDRLEELVPRAEAGSRERQLEKKREVAASNKAFADAKAGDMEEVNESALMGGEESFREHKAALERKKNERELRKEAMLRARQAEREERLQVHRAKEEQTMKMLRALAEKFR